MLSNFSKVLVAHTSFTAVINNRGIGKGIDGIRKGTKKNYIKVVIKYYMASFCKGLIKGILKFASIFNSLNEDLRLL